MTYLGIDGGGSKTTFLLVDDDGREIYRWQSGPSNWLSVGRDAAAASIREGVSKLGGTVPSSICGGFAGAGRPEGREFYLNVLEPLFPGARVRVESDAFVAYAGALGLKPGVLLIAGTGSIAIGRTTTGSMIRVGGWGPHFGDEGGGFWIGREAIRMALRSLDSEENNEFARRIASKLGLPAIENVVAGWGAGKIGVPDVAGLFPEILDMWPAEPAAGILRLAAGHLRAIAQTAMQRIGNSNCPVSFAGSVASYPLLQQLIGLEFTSPEASAERGAITLARSLPS